MFHSDRFAPGFCSLRIRLEEADMAKCEISCQNVPEDSFRKSGMTTLPPRLLYAFSASSACRLPQQRPQSSLCPLKPNKQGFVCMRMLFSLTKGLAWKGKCWQYVCGMREQWSLLNLRLNSNTAASAAHSRAGGAANETDACGTSKRAQIYFTVRHLSKMGFIFSIALSFTPAERLAKRLL